MKLLTAPDPVRADLDALAAALADGLVDSELELERRLGPLTTYRVGGAARLFVEVTSVADLDTIANAVATHGGAVLVVGKGSNLLVADAGFDGLVLRLGDAFAGLETNGHELRVGAAASLPVVARQSVASAVAGFEWAVGVPGSIGGAVRMNAGGHGSDMAAAVRSVRVADLETGEIVDLASSDLEFAYRSSSIRSTQVVLETVLDLEEGDPEQGSVLLSEIVRWRREHQPGGQNAGSVFTNPVGDSAGRLIDATGLKGLRIGTAEVSTKHANFIQADVDGSADDVRALMREIAHRVADHTGVSLHAETCLVGFDDERADAPSDERASSTGVTDGGIHDR